MKVFVIKRLQCLCSFTWKESDIRFELRNAGLMQGRQVCALVRAVVELNLLVVCNELNCDWGGGESWIRRVFEQEWLFSSAKTHRFWSFHFFAVDNRLE